MKVELLNVEKVKVLIDANGWKRSWVIEQIGESRTSDFGFPLLREGRLPKDPERKKEVLRKLSKLLGVPAKDLVVTLEAKAS